MQLLLYKFVYIFLWIGVFLGVASPDEMNKTEKKIDFLNNNFNNFLECLRNQ